MSISQKALRPSRMPDAERAGSRSATEMMSAASLARPRPVRREMIPYRRRAAGASLTSVAHVLDDVAGAKVLLLWVFRTGRRGQTRWSFRHMRQRRIAHPVEFASENDVLGVRPTCEQVAQTRQFAIPQSRIFTNAIAAQCREHSRRITSPDRRKERNPQAPQVVFLRRRAIGRLLRNPAPGNRSARP